MLSICNHEGERKTNQTEPYLWCEIWDHKYLQLHHLVLCSTRLAGWSWGQAGPGSAAWQVHHCLWKTWPAREAVVNKRQIFRSLQEKCITTAPTPAHSQILTTVKLKQVQLPFRNTLMLKRLCLHLPYTGLQKSDCISSPRLKEKVAPDKREWVCYTWKWSAAIQSKVIYHSISLYWPVSFSIYKNSSGLILFLYRRNSLDPLSWTTSFVFSWTRVLTYKT